MHSQDEAVIDLAIIQAQQQQQRQGQLDTVASPSSNLAPRRTLKHRQRGHRSDQKECPRHTTNSAGLPNKLVTRELDGKRVVSLYYGSDVVLFDEIVAWRKTNPNSRVEDAVDEFEEHQGADALANIVYQTQAFDMVFKYPIPEHLRKVADEPPVLGLGPNISDIEIDSQSSAAIARKEERRQAEEQVRQQKLAEEAARAAAMSKEGVIDLEKVPLDPKVIKDEKLEKLRYRFKKALLKESLIIEEEPNIEGEEMYIKVYTPFWRLCIEAQRLRYKMELSHFETQQEKDDKAAQKAKANGFWQKNFWRYIQRADIVSLPLRAESLLFKASKLRQYKLAEKSRKWSDIVRHGGGIKPDGSGVGAHQGSDGEDGFFGTARRGNLTESIVIYCKLHTKRGDRQALRTVMDKGALTDFFALHDGSYKSKVKPTPNRRTWLYHRWVRSGRTQPLEEIRFYYGEKIALYFAWIGHYTRWLLWAAIAGVLFLIYGLAADGINIANNNTANNTTNRNTTSPDGKTSEELPMEVRIFDNALTLPYALFMSVWASLFVEYWKRKSNVLAYTWNTLDFERRERARPEFKPTSTRISPVTGKIELYYPRYKQLISFFMSIIVVLVSIGIVVVSVGSLMLFGIWTKLPMADGTPRFKNSYVSTVVTALLNLTVIMLLGTIYARVAKFLTDNENHRRLTQYEDALILKRFLFDFVNFYSALFYIAYIKREVDVTLPGDTKLKDSCSKGGCMADLTIQLAIVFVGKQFLNQFQELAIPQLHKYWNRKNELAEKAKLVGKYKDKKNFVKPPQWAKDDILPTYNPQMFEEYRELVIQFGFCTLFVTAFPIAPIFALINNVLEIRVDAYKLLTQHRRPIAQAAQDIGSWGYILALITHISVLTNATLIAFQSNWMEHNVFRNMGWVANYPESEGSINYALLAVRLLFIFFYEHLVFLVKIAVANLVTDMPQTVKLAIERENYYTRLALDDEEPAMDEVLEDLDDDNDESEDEEEMERQRAQREAAEDAEYEAKLKHRNHSHDSTGSGVAECEAEKAADAEADPEGIKSDADDEEEDEEELEAMIRAGGCGCAAHGDGVVGTARGGFEGTWMNRFKPENQAAIRRRQRRRNTKGK
ncbi:Anoctamin-7 [Podila humilis]|nr:Anoctamin-7 [Podila humilis]